jgi:fumarate reductase flavoprotein subunit
MAAGVHLLNGVDDRYIFDYDPKGGCASRAVVSRAMYQETQWGRGTPHGGILTRRAHLGSEKWRATSRAWSRCRDCGFDLAGGDVEVVPAHYVMGAIRLGAGLRYHAQGALSGG